MRWLIDKCLNSKRKPDKEKIDALSEARDARRAHDMMVGYARGGLIGTMELLEDIFAENMEQSIEIETIVEILNKEIHKLEIKDSDVIKKV